MGYLFAQLPDYHVQFFDESYGMRTNMERVIKDKRDFIWLTTQENIYRFDGKNMDAFPCHEFVLSILSDENNVVWLNSSANIYRFQDDHQGFVRVPFDTTGEVSLGRIFQLPQHPMWLQTSIGFFEWDEAQYKFRKLDLSSLGVPAHVSTLAFSNFGNTIFFPSNDSLYAINIELKTKLTQSRPNLGAGYMNAISDHDLLITHRGDSTSWLDFNEKKLLHIDFKYELPGSNNDFLYIRDAVPIDEHRVFLATHNGLLELDLRTRKFRRLRLYHKGYQIDPTPNYFDLFLDENRKVWSLQGIGLVSFSPDQESIGLIRDREVGDTYTWPNNARNLVEDEKGNIWMSTSEGFGYWNHETNTIKMYRAVQSAKDRLNIPSVRGLYYDQPNLIMGTSSSGVWIFNTTTEKFSRPVYSADSTGIALKRKLEIDFIKQIIKLPNGNIFIVGRDCYTMDPENFHVKEFDISFASLKQPNFGYLGKDGYTWLVAQDAIICFNRQMERINDWKTNISISTMHEFGKDEWIVGTTKGLFIMRTEGDSITLSRHDKLADHTRVWFITTDKMGRYWIGSNNGLSRYDPLTNNVEYFDFSDNIQGSTWALEPMLAHDGTLFVGGNNGINYFHADKIEIKKEKLQVSLMRVSVNQDDTSYFNRDKLLSLKSFQNTIEIEFVAPYYGNPNRMQYRYQLKGLSSEWKQIENSNEVRFARLPPGEYTFNVAASVNGTQWFQNIASLHFIIATPFWQRWWFLGICLIVICSVIFYFLKRRIDLIQQKEKVKRDYEKRIAEVEMHALRAQMNPHFMFNSLNSINNFILKNDPDNASGYLTKFSRLMRLILDNSRSEWVKLENELKALELYIELEVVRFDNVFDFEINVAPDIDLTTTSIPPMIIQPYVENAIWHGLLHRDQPGGKLCVKLWREDDQLNITIEDNGVGREEAKRLKSKSATKHKSHGMKITAERIDIVNRIYNVNATVHIDDLTGLHGEVVGTKVTLTLQDQIYDSHHSG